MDVRPWEFQGQTWQIIFIWEEVLGKSHLNLNVKKMYLKNKALGRGRAFLIGVTIRKDMDEKNRKHVQVPAGSLVLLKCKGNEWGVKVATQAGNNE